MEFDNNFTMIAITVNHYDIMTEEVTRHLFTDILERNENIAIAFIDFPYLSFLQYTTQFKDDILNHHSSFLLIHLIILIIQYLDYQEKLECGALLIMLQLKNN